MCILDEQIENFAIEAFVVTFSHSDFDDKDDDTDNGMTMIMVMNDDDEEDHNRRRHHRRRHHHYGKNEVETSIEIYWAI